MQVYLPAFGENASETVLHTLFCVDLANHVLILNTLPAWSGIPP
jgi:hypothetical protein